MKSTRRYLQLLVGTVLMLAPVISAGPAFGAVTVNVSKTTGLVDGDTVTISLADIPAGQGVYIRQCYRPAVGQRDVSGLKCNGSLQRVSEMIWASSNPAFLRQGALNVSSAMSLVVKSNVVMYESDGKSVKETLPCGISDCAIFVHRDHLGLQDTALDTVVPLTFLGLQSIKARLMGFPSDGSKVIAGKSLSLKASQLVTDQKVKLRVLSETPKVCAVENGKTFTAIQFLKKGSCTLQLVAKATSTHLRFTTSLTYLVG